MSKSRVPHPGDVIAHKYEIVRLLGQGGMGAVFEARHTIIEKSVALKWLHSEGDPNPESMHRLIREARAAGRIHHPNVVAIHDVGEHEGSLFLVMEYLRGRSLDARLAASPLTPFDALTLLVPAMRGVHAAHENGVLHRDLKPANLFVCEGDGLQPILKVLDFGVSKIVDPRYEEAASTQTGAQLGTPAYMSPEQLRGDRTIDRRVDVYSFGVILYRVFSGRLPFTAASASGLAIKAATTDAPPLSSLNPEIPPALSLVVAKAMARNRDQRFEDMQALIEALEPFVVGFDAPAPQISRAVASTNTLHATAAGVSATRATRVRFGVWATGALAATSGIIYFAATRPAPQTASGSATTDSSKRALVAPSPSHVETAPPAPASSTGTSPKSDAPAEPKRATHPIRVHESSRPRPPSGPSTGAHVQAAAPAGASAVPASSARHGVHLSVDDF